MGHLKMKPVGAPIIPAPTKLSLRMTPDGSGGRFQLGAAGDTITGGLSCVPFLSLIPPALEGPGETGTPGLWRYTLAVDGDTKTCGECIEWVLSEFYEANEQEIEPPVVTLSAMPDCLGLFVDIQFAEGAESIPQNWIFAVRPFINGQRFGYDTGFAIEFGAGGGCVDYCTFYVPGTAGIPWDPLPTGVTFDDWNTIYYDPGFTGDISFSLFMAAPDGASEPSLGQEHVCDPGEFAWNAVESGQPMIASIIDWPTNGGSPYEIQFLFNPQFLSGDTVTIQPTINGVEVCEPFTIQPL